MRGPTDAELEEHVRLLWAAAVQLIESGTPAGLFTGYALRAWLLAEGRGPKNLVRDFIGVVRPKSRRTAQAVCRALLARGELSPHHDDTKDSPARPCAARAFDET